MHNKAKEMACWAMDKAKSCGYDNISSQDWDDLKDCMEAAKAAVCIDKDYRIIEAMDKADKEEQIGMYRMGYNNRRYASGQYAPAGHGHYAGYHPYMEEDDYMSSYLRDPNQFEENMRMGYTPRRMIYGYDQYPDHAGLDGYVPNRSHYGEAYDGWENARRHFTETHDSKSKEEMEKYTKEHMHRAVDSMLKMYKEAEPELKDQMRSEVEKLMGQM